MAVAKRKNGIWQVIYRDYSQKVQSKYFPKGADGRRDAYAYDAEIKGLKAARKELPSARVGEELYLDELSQQWIDAKKAQGRKLCWIKDWAHIMDIRVLPTLGTKPVSTITETQVLALVNKYWENNSQATKNRYVGYLKSIFEYAVKRKQLEVNPLGDWVPGKEPRRKSPLTVEMLKDIKANAAEHLAWALEVMWEVPIRPGPMGLYSLRYDKHFKPERSGFEVYHEKVGRWAFVRVSEEFALKIKTRQLQSKSGYIIEYKGKPVKRLSRALNTTAKKLKYPSISMYDVRHCWITYAVDKGLELSTIAYLAGTSVEMLVKNYYEPHAAEQLRAINILDSLEGGKVVQGKKPKVLESKYRAEA